MPFFTTEIVEVLSPTNPFGIKSGSEGATAGAPAVIISGIVDALKEFGIRDIKMPATPLTVWQAIEKAKAELRSKQAAAPPAPTNPVAVEAFGKGE